MNPLIRSLALLGFVAVSACTDESAGAPDLAEADSLQAPAVQDVLVRASDYAFEMPDTLYSGVTQFRLVNDGSDMHHVYMVRLDGAHTADELLQALSAGPPPAWAVDVGGPNAPGAPGSETNATLVLDPGRYAVLCVIPDPAGVPHIMHGMSKELTVVPSATPAAVLPEPTVIMTLDDYSFETDVPLTAGRHTIRIENAATQPHEVLLVRLEAGRTPPEVVNFIATRQGPPPGAIVGGVTGIAPGRINQITVDLPAGEYALLCFIPDARDGAPHVAHGMMKQIAIS
jgi:hypothetical protein